MLQESVANPSEMTIMPLADLFVPAWNPRSFIDPAGLAELVAYIEKGGRVPRIVVWKGNGQGAGSSISGEPTHPNREPRLGASVQGPYAVISGQRRLAAYEKLEKTHIDVEVLDITLEEARFLAIASNRDDKPFWLGEFIAVESLMLDNPALKQVDIIDGLGWPKKRVSYAVNLMKLLNPASRELIYTSSQPKVPSRNFLEAQTPENESSKTSWQLTEEVAIRLIALGNNPSWEAAQSQTEQAIKLMIERQMTGSQTADLVAWAQAGNDIAQFEPAAKVRKARTAPETKAAKPSPTANNTPSSSMASAHTTHNREATEDKVAPVEAAPAKPTAGAPMGSAETITDSHPHASSVHTSSAKLESASSNRAPQLGVSEQILWEGLAGMSLVARIKAKIKKGERPSLFEGLVLVADLLWRGTAWVAKHAWKIAAWFVKETWKASKASLMLLGRKVFRIVGGVLGFVFLCFVVWFGWDAYERGILHPFEEIGTVWAIVHSKPASNQTTSTPRPVVPHNPAVVPAQAVTVVPTISQTVPTPVPTEKLVVKKRAAAVSAPNVAATPVAQNKKVDPLDDLANTVVKQAGPDAATNAAKKIFGL